MVKWTLLFVEPNSTVSACKILLTREAGSYCLARLSTALPCHQACLARATIKAVSTEAHTKKPLGVIHKGAHEEYRYVRSDTDGFQLAFSDLQRAAPVRAFDFAPYFATR